MLKEDKTIDQPSNQKNIVQLIIFLVGKEEFGVPIEVVREIIKVGMITPIPNFPSYIKGIINVRGEIVTTIDIKARFEITDDKKSPPKHIVVSKQEDGLFGLLVDEVIEVLRIENNAIAPPPPLVTQVHRKYINGVVSHDGRLIVVLNLSQLLSKTDLINLNQFHQKVDRGKKGKKVQHNQNDTGI